ncbi:GLUG motif-containing protein [Ructibacterium gallinarum]|uniref:GLUG domain-containing protein n=1 Tax=Ructibacterium gallinarum TaxID=2779355 RepID=A0A9D5M257_9FIRM|nr:GLUG motif-containing protein [Ructibacterium gallinarum]MBE5039314.1 hypothetical protein [Ructibacterium gallinarum]
MMRRIMSAIAACLFFMEIFPVISVEAEGETVPIRTVEDLNYLAENCVYDAYSKNKQVVLLNDIDFQGNSFKPIPVFCGTFEGNGYRIFHFKQEFTGAEQGFIVRTSEDAVLKNLNLSGEITVNSPKSKVTSAKDMAANLAKTFGLKFNDDQERIKITGGIVGSNYGVIQNCSFSGTIAGEIKTGGIAGENRESGVIDYCMNTAAVSGYETTGGIAGSNQGRIESSKNAGIVNQEADASAVDTGGIAGENLGVIRGCVNEAAVGCFNIGDNTGGIAGKQKGRISACNNLGEIKGRKNTGGITGRFEPYTDIDLSAEGVRDFVQTGVDSIEANIQDTKEHAQTYADTLVGDADKVTDQVTGVLNEVHSAAGNIADAVSGLSSGEEISQLRGDLSAMMEAITYLVDRAGGEGLDSVSGTLETFQDSVAELDRMLEGAETAAGEIGKTAEEIDNLAGSLSDAVEDGRTDAQKTIDELQSRIEDLERLETDYLKPFQEDLEKTQTELQRMLHALRISAGDISDAVTRPLERVDQAVSDLIETVEELQDKIEEIRKKTEKLIEKIQNKLPKNPPSIIGKIFNKMGMSVYAAEEKKIVTVEAPLYRSVAGEWVDMAVIDQCFNSGEIEGSSAAGGIAGNVGVESDVKEGENLNLTASNTIDLKGYVKATIRQCIAEQNVSARDGYVGAVVGNAELGWIYESIGSGDITAQDGEYAGGIVGRSEGTISRCISIADLKGKKYVGGIAGRGKNISFCYSLPRYEEGIEYNGAIAGMISGEVQTNYFIQEGLSGVDGADYENVAVAVAPWDMAGTDVLPPSYSGFSDQDWFMGSGDLYLPQIRTLAEAQNGHNSELLRGKSAEMALFHFRVVFYQDDQQLAAYTVDYGTVLSEEMIPEPEWRDGYYPRWDQDVFQPIIRNTDFHALYHDATTTIATDEDPPLMLVEGNFTEDAKLTATQIENIAHFGYRYKNIASYSFEIIPEYNGKICVHIRDESGKGNMIGIIRDGEKVLIPCERDGNYLIFELNDEREFSVLHQGHTALYWAGIFLMVVTAVVFVLLFWKRIHTLSGEHK